MFICLFTILFLIVSYIKSTFFFLKSMYIMTSSMKILYMLVGIIILTSVTSILFNFFGIEFASYGNYLLWFIALAIFYIVLPSGENNIFK